MSQQVVVLGSGFAALTAVRRLRRKGFTGPLTVVSPQAEFVYYPSLIWMPAKRRHGDDLRVDLQAFFEASGVSHRRAEVVGLADAGRTVLTDHGPVANDALIIATGGRFLKRLPGIEHTIALCEGVTAGQRITEGLEGMDGGHITFGFSGNPKEPSAMRGGPMFELMFGTDTLLRRQGRRERFELTFFSPAAEPGKRLGEGAVERLVKALEKRGIRTHLGHGIESFEPDAVNTAGGRIRSDLTLFMPGMTGPTWLDNTDLPRSPGGLIEADAQCRVPGFERVYAAGDVGSFPGPAWMPKQAHMADLQADAAVDNLLEEAAGRTGSATYRPELVCIIDSLDQGILVYRDAKRSVMLPPSRLFHWAKRLFEWWYLRPYRRPNRRGPHRIGDQAVSR